MKNSIATTITTVANPRTLSQLAVVQREIEKLYETLEADGHEGLTFAAEMVDSLHDAWAEAVQVIDEDDAYCSMVEN